MGPNPVLYWDPFAHAGGEEYRLGVGWGSFHFREQYPPVPQYDDPFYHPEDHPGGRKTILDQFHCDRHDPSRYPREHVDQDVLHLPFFFDYFDLSDLLP